MIQMWRLESCRSSYNHEGLSATHFKKLNDSGKIEEGHGKFTVLFLQESTGVDKTHVWDGILFAVDIIKLGIPWINPIISVLREMRYMCTH